MGNMSVIVIGMILLLIYLVLPGPIKSIVNGLGVLALIAIVSAYIDEWMRDNVLEK